MEKEEVTKFGFEQVGNKTPAWANWIFRITLYLCSLLILALTTLNTLRLGLSAEDVKDLVAALSLGTLAIHALSKMVGMETKPEDYKIG